MAVFTPHGMSFMFSFVFSDVHGCAFLGLYWCAWLLLSCALLVFMVMFSSALLVFTIIVLLGSIGIHHVVMFSWAIGVCGHVLFSSIDILIIAFLGSIGVCDCCSLGVY
jgi:hypothetical protein